MAVGDGKMVRPPTLSLHLLVTLPPPEERTVEALELLEGNVEKSFVTLIHVCRDPLSKMLLRP